MILQPQLYVDVSGSPFGTADFQRLEFFGWESIELDTTVQDARDISKIFTDYSKSFSIPASGVNNKVFKHYYNTLISDGFDARIKQRAEIYLNGILFKVGYVRLNDAIVKKGKSYSYNITFFGSLSTLNNVLGGDKLSDLPSLNKYNHEYNADTVYNGFTTGLGLEGTDMVTSTNRDIIYPAISNSAYWYFDRSGVVSDIPSNQGINRNIFNDGATTNYGITYTDLKPAIKVSHIIDAISEKYDSLEFSGDFFGSAEFSDAYMLLHNNKGLLSPTSSEINDYSLTYRLGTDNSNSDFVEDTSSVEELRPLTTYMETTGESLSNGDLEYRVFNYALDIVLSNTVKAGGGSDPIYDVNVFKGNDLINQFIGIEGDQTVQHILCTRELTTWDDIRIEIGSTSAELTQFEMGLILTKQRYKLHGATNEFLCDVSNFNDTAVTSTSIYDTAVTGVQNMVSTIEVARNMPKMKIVDLLKGLFSAFNLTAYVDELGVTVVLPLTEYYRAGSSINITPNIDSNQLSIKRMPLYRNMEFSFKKPTTFGILNNNELKNTEFGDLEYNTNEDGSAFDLAFDGKDYKVQLPFEKLYFERMLDQNDNLERTEMGYGWLVNQDQDDVLTKPVLFYNNVQQVDTTKTPVGFKGKANQITQYNRPSNTDAGEYYNSGTTSWITTPATKSMNFNAEFDEFTNTLASNGLFRGYYSDYIKSVFDKRSRLFTLKMKANLKFLLNYKMNDTLTIDGDEYLINRLRTNLTTGITNLELILKFYIEELADTIGATLTAPLNVSLVYRTRSAIVFNWSANPLEEIVKKYRIYVDGVRVSTDADEYYRTSYTLTGLDPLTSYDITVEARDSQDNASPLSNVLTVVTLASDTESPTVAGSPFITVINNEFSSVNLEWIAATDNIAVTYYELYKDNVLQSSPVTNSATMNVTSGVQHDLYVKAYDAAGNYSESPISQIRVNITI